MEQKEMKELFKQGWMEVLHLEEVDDDTDFFEAGGNSIMAVQLPSWLVQKGIKLDMMDIFTTPTFGELAKKLKETEPLYMPEEMITKEIAAEKMGFGSVEEGRKAEQGIMSGTRDSQVCTPEQQKANDSQVCTPEQQKAADSQVCTPEQQKAADSQVCTPTQQSGQVCTPTQPSDQICTPTVQQYSGNMPMQTIFVPVYIPVQAFNAMAGFNNVAGAGSIQQAYQICTPAQQSSQVCTPTQASEQICTPAQQSSQVCTPNNNQGYSAANAQNIPPQLQEYFPKQVDKAIENPNVVKISKAKLAEKTKTPEKALMDVMVGILPTFDRNRDFFEQGISSLDTVKMVSRCAEAGYELDMKDIYMHSTFDELLGYLK